MRWRLGITLLTATALLAAGAAQGEVFQSGNLRVILDGGFSPRQLPRERPVPIAMRIDSRISTLDGTRPPALRQLRIGLNRNGLLSTRGLPVCEIALLQSTTSEAALRACQPALVGRGSFSANVELDGGTVATTGEILAFNSRVGGAPGIALHFNVTVPIVATLVLPLSIGHRSHGAFGTVLSATVPRLAGGLGSITHIELRIGRTYTYRGQRLGLISAACAAPAGFNIAIFPFARGSFTFAGGRHLDIALTRTCHVR